MDALVHVGKSKYFRRLALVIFDCLCCALSLFVGLKLWNIDIPIRRAIPAEDLIRFSGLYIGAHLIVFLVGGMYNVIWRFAGITDALWIVVLEFAVAALSWAAKSIMDIQVPVNFMFITCASALIMIILGRFTWRMLYAKALHTAEPVRTERIMIVGADESASYTIDRCVAEMGYTRRSIVLVDDDPQKQRCKINGVSVRGTSADIAMLVARFETKDILIAITSLSGEKYARLVSLCAQTKCRVRVLNALDDVASGGERTRYNKRDVRFRSIDASDFLAREEIHLDASRISAYLKGQTVLITGGAGSIGSELCRQTLRFEPKALYIMDSYENTAYELYMELKRTYGNIDHVKVLIGSVRDARRLAAVFELVRPDVVFHAAAHKHVPLMEDSPWEAVKNNIIGTRNLLEAAASHAVKRFVLLSTDKAVNPTNVMGATKRVCEKLVQIYALRSDMKCMAVRFGNVLGSHGSVIPLFESQIRAGGPVTVTDPQVERYFMTIPEAAQLVLQAGGFADSGAIYVLNMGERVLIKDLAEKMIIAYGYTPNVDIHIQYTGLRPGEKLYEELLMPAELAQMTRTAHERIMIAPPSPLDETTVMRLVERLANSLEDDPGRARELLENLVENYKSDTVRAAREAS
jgi:FlaA1/EpsC-like NDP-sugar epimerase